MIETLRPKPEINHEHIAQAISDKALGEVFTIEIPEGTEFTASDYNKIDLLFQKKSQQPGAQIAILDTPAFVLGAGPKSLVVYKDTILNINLFRKANEDIERILQTHPELYSAMMNKLISRLPVAEQQVFGILPVDPRTRSRIVTNLEMLPVTVVKALRQLIDDPNQVSQ